MEKLAIPTDSSHNYQVTEFPETANLQVEWHDCRNRNLWQPAKSVLILIRISKVLHKWEK